jgi:hypothetical protein
MQAAGSIYSVELGNLEAHTECVIRLSYLRQVRHGGADHNSWMHGIFGGAAPIAVTDATGIEGLAGPPTPLLLALVRSTASLLTCSWTEQRVCWSMHTPPHGCRHISPLRSRPMALTRWVELISMGAVELMTHQLVVQMTCPQHAHSSQDARSFQGRMQ